MFVKTILIQVSFFTLLASMVFLSTAYADDAKEEAEEDKAAIAAFLESSVASGYHKSAYGYAIFPTIGKAGFGIGGAHGSGRVHAAGKKTGDISMTQVSFGLQAGGQAYRQVIYFENKAAFDTFTAGDFEFNAQAEAIALTASAGASAGTEGLSASANESQTEKSKYFDGMVVFTMGKGGLMYQAALGGQKYSYTPTK